VTDDLAAPEGAERGLHGVGIVERLHLRQAGNAGAGLPCRDEKGGRRAHLFGRQGHRAASVSSVAIDGTNTTSISTANTISV
jgi:hypothetical protein